MRTLRSPAVRVVLDNGRATGVLCVLYLVDVGCTLALPYTVGAAVDSLLVSGAVTAAVLAVCLLLIGHGLVEFAAEMVEASVRAGSTARLRHRLFAHVVSVGPPVRRRFTVGELLGRCIESAGEVGAAVPTVLGMVFSGLTSVGGLVALTVIDPRLAVAFVLGLPVVLLLARRLVRFTGELTVRYQSAHADMSTRFVDAVRGARTIRASATLDRETDRVLGPLAILRATGWEFWDIQRRAGWHLTLVAVGLQLAVLLTAGFGVAGGWLTPGELLAAQLYLTYALRMPAQAAALGQLGRVRASAARAGDVLDVEASSRGRADLPPGPGRLTLRGVCVSIGDRRILDGIDLDVPAGARVAVVGASGSGKSTVALVAGGVSTPDSGSVCLDGVDLATVRRDALSGAVAYAFDRPAPLGDTVADLISYGDHRIPAGTIRKAARVCHAEDFVDRLPAGFATPVADLRLSGGELQRLGLARAACRTGARVLVLDDALSGVDTATQHLIERAMAEALPGRTTLVVAHRMTTAAGADLVAWLENGRVRALAPPEALVDDPDYRTLFHSAEESR